MKPASLLRWYPRAWRERYGEELLALIQDTLEDGRPTWRLRLGVIRGGLRERGYQARQASTAAVKQLGGGLWLEMLIAGAIVANLPQNLSESPSPARGWPTAAAFDAVLAAIALTGAVVLACGLTALPALVRFLRAGGWPKIRRPVTWAAGATVVAGGGLAGLVIFQGPLSPAQLAASWPYTAGYLATGLAMTGAFGLWALAAAATAKHFTLAARVRTVQLILLAVTSTAVMVVLMTLNFLWAATQTPLWLVAAVAMLGAATVNARLSIPRAVRRGRRLRATSGGDR